MARPKQVATNEVAQTEQVATNEVATAKGIPIKVNFSSIQIEGVDYVAKDGTIIIPADLVEIVQSHNG